MQDAKGAAIEDSLFFEEEKEREIKESATIHRSCGKKWTWRGRRKRGKMGSI